MSKMTISIGKGKDSINVTTAKKDIRTRVNDVILAALAAEFGEDAAAMVRVTSETTARGENLVAAIVADIAEDGGVFDGAVTVKVTVKEWTDRIGTKSVKPAWDFTAAREEFEVWESETAQKAAEKAAAKSAKAKADAEARAKRKAEAEARKAAK